MATTKLTRDDCILLLRNKQELLRDTGRIRFPQRSDFSEEEVIAIKAFLGPWPRALEAAGLKEPRKDDRLQKNREKRARARKRRLLAQKAAGNQENMLSSPRSTEEHDEDTHHRSV